jgi:RNA polymerase sigma factor (sigma-70 family)
MHELMAICRVADAMSKRREAPKASAVVFRTTFQHPASFSPARGSMMMPAATRPVGRPYHPPASKWERIMTLSMDDPLPPDDRSQLKPSGPDIAALYRSESPRLARYFSRRVAPHEVFDLVHDAFRKLLGAANDRGVHFDNPQAYLTRVADNLVRDRARSLTHRASAVSEPLDESRLGGPDPLDRLEQRDTLKRIEAAVMTLKPRTREIFLLRQSDGLSYVEIAGRMGISVKGVERQMTKALTHLRRKLDRA